MRLRTLVAGLLTAALVTGAAIAISGGPANAASPAADYTKSTIGGTINWQEVLDRAHYWYATLKPVYNSDASAWDLGHTKQYRTDCSGFVAMALHMSVQDSTYAIPDDTRFTPLYNLSNSADRAKLTPLHIQTGDVFDDITGSEHHAWIFGDWSSDGTHFTYYSFGQTPVEHLTGTFADAKLAHEATSHYKVYRYKKIDMSSQGVYDGPPHS